MKYTPSDMIHFANNSGDIHKSEQVLRRDLSLQNDAQIPDMKSARNMAEQLQILEKYVAKITAVDPFLCNSMRSAIATGDYIIDPARIAEKFLKFEETLYS